MPTTREIPRDEWQSYFDDLVTQQALRASVEIVGAELGDQTEAEKLPLDSISHDDQANRLTIGLGGADRYPVVLWHTIERPLRVEVREQDGVADAILIEDSDDVHTVLSLFRGE
jgi:uncharacterized protein DUF5335